MYADMSDVTDSTSDYTSRMTIDEDMHTASVDVEGWNKGSKPVRVTVSATYTGPTAPNGFDLGMITLTRAGDASVADFATYGCEMKTDAEGGKGCANGYEAVSGMRFGRGDTISINGMFVDILGTKADNVRARVKIAPADKDALTGTKAGAADVGFTLGSDIVKIENDAPYGDYTITVTNGESGDDEVMQELAITAAGPPVTYEFDNPAMYIPATLGSSQMFTLMAMDENDNVPDFSDAKDVEIVVLGVEGSYVTGRDGNNAKFDAETGQASFTIFAPVGATQGQTVLIQVRVDGAVVASHTVMFGMAMEAADTDTSLQDIPDSSIRVTNNANSSITVNWMGGDNADSFIVVAAELGSDPFTYEQNVAGGAAKMATISGLNSGSNYMVIVIALQGSNFEYGVLQIVMAN